MRKDITLRTLCKSFVKKVKIRMKGSSIKMPRCARIKSVEAIFHIISRSISEVDMFRDDDDKVHYMNLVRKYQLIYRFKVYSYCLMDNHTHFLIYVNGADISKIMHDINFSYVQYFNNKHKRHGHLMQDRFKSKIVDSERYLLTLTGYIHNNPTDLPFYGLHPEKYRFSSLAVYLGITKDVFKVIDNKFLVQILGDNFKSIKNTYKDFVLKCDDKLLKEEAEMEDQKTCYEDKKTILVRDFKAEEIVDFIMAKLKISKIELNLKNYRKITEARALLVVIMRSLCNYNSKAICSFLGNVTQSQVSKLSLTGAKLIEENDLYKGILEELIGRNRMVGATGCTG